MKKKLGLVGLVVLLVLLLFPYVLSGILKLRYQHWCVLADEKYGLQVESIAYNQHYLSSDIETFLIFQPNRLVSHFAYKMDPNPDRDQATYGLLLRHKMYHGPIIFDGKGSKEKRFPIAQGKIYTKVFVARKVGDGPVTAMIGGKEFSLAKATIRYNGSGRLDIESNGFHVDDPKRQQKFRWRGLNGFVDFAQGFTGFKTNMQVMGFEFQGPSSRMDVRDVVLHSDKTLTNRGLWLGSLDIKSNLIYHKPKPEAEAFSLREAVYHSESALEEAKVKADASLQFASLRFRDYEYGPGSIKASVENLNSEVLYRLRNLLDEDENAPPIYQAIDITDNFLDDLPALLKNRPKIHFEIPKLETEDGSVSASGTLLIGGKKELKGKHSLSKLLASADAKLQFLVPKAFVAHLLEPGARERIRNRHHITADAGILLSELDSEIANSLTMLESHGWLVAERNNYRFHFALQEGRMQLNEQSTEIVKKAE